MDRREGQHEAAHSRPDTGLGDLSERPISSDGSSTVTHVNTNPVVGLSVEAVPNQWSPPPASPGVSAMTISEYDIELDPLPLPPAGAYSTEQLLPDHAELVDSTNTIKPASSGPPPLPTPLRPNYKPIPLRWGYHLLLLALIAGFFVFLEYETRLLPAPKYHAFRPAPVRTSEEPDNGHSTPVQARSWLKREWADHTQAPIGPTQPPQTTWTRTERTGPITATPTRAIFARDPIPPPSEYPDPSTPAGYCFWYPPEWRFLKDMIYYYIREYIMFFSVAEDNQDVPLCPCHQVIYTEGNVTRVRMGSVDEYCDAVINVIKTVEALRDRKNSYWQGGYPYTTSYPWWYQSDRWWIRPPNMTVPWIFPSYAPNGDVFLPLEKRTTAPGPNGEAVSDVFGKRLQAPYVGYFPAGHTGVETFFTTWGWDVSPTEIITWPATRSVFWWKLPLTRPDSDLFMGDPSTSSMPSSSIVDPGIITTDAPTSGATASPTLSSSSRSPVPPPDPATSSSSQPTASPSRASSSTTTVAPPSNILSSVASPSTTSPTRPLPSSTAPELSTSQSSASSTSVEINTIISPISSSEQGTHASQNPSLADTQTQSTGIAVFPTTSHVTSSSTAVRDLTSGEVVRSTIVLVTNTFLSTTGTSTIIDVQPITTNGTTGVITITKSIIPLISTKTIVSASPTTWKIQTMGWLEFQSLHSIFPTPISRQETRRIFTEVSTKTYYDPSNGSPTRTYTGIFETWTEIREFPSSTVTLYSTAELSFSPWRPTGVSIAPDHGSAYAPDTNKFFSLDSEKDFLMASLIPVLLATCLAIPIQIFIKNFNHLVPFRALRYRKGWGTNGRVRLEGAEAQDSLCLDRGGINVFTAPKIAFRFLRKYHDPLPLLSFLLDLFTTLLIPLASESIQIEFGKDRCTSLDWPVVQVGYRGPCAIGLRKSVLPSRAAEAFLSVMAFLVLVMGIMIWRWRTGVAADPWSVASMTALLAGSSREVNRLMLGINPPHPLPGSSPAELPSLGGTKESPVNPASGKDIARALKGKRFRLGYFQANASPYDGYSFAHSHHGDREMIQKSRTSYGSRFGKSEPYQQISYGLELVSPDEAETGSIHLTSRDPPSRTSAETKTTHKGSYLRDLVRKAKRLTFAIRGPKETGGTSRGSQKRPTSSIVPPLFLVLISGLLIVILYYENTILDTPFERFMDSQTYGVRFLFTAMGTGITAFWDYYFAYVCEKQHFSQLHVDHAAQGNPDDQRQRERRDGQPSEQATPVAHTPDNTTAGNLSPDNQENPQPPCPALHSQVSGTTVAPTTKLDSTSTCVHNDPRALTTTNAILNTIPSTELTVLYRAFFPSRAKFRTSKSQPCTCNGEKNKTNTLRTKSSNLVNRFKRNDLTVASVSVAAFLAKFAPILLSGVPFRNTITWKMHETYTWCLVAVLGYMVLVLGVLLFPAQLLRELGGLFKASPSRGGGRKDMKQDRPPPPTSIAGYMYYVCDSFMLRDFEGLSTSPRKVRDKAVMYMAAGHYENGSGTCNEQGKYGTELSSRRGAGFAFGTMTGVSGVRRVGTDYANGQ